MSLSSTIETPRQADLARVAFVKKREAARQLQCSVSKLERLARAGSIEFRKSGATVLIPQASIDAYLLNLPRAQAYAA